MATHEMELKALMVASQDGDAAAHRALLARLSGHLRAYYKRRLAIAGKGATEAEDLVQETVLAIHIKRYTYDAAVSSTADIHYSPQRAAVSSLAACSLVGLDAEPTRSPAPVHERLHLFHGQLAIFVRVHCLEDSFVSRLKLLQ